MNLTLKSQCVNEGTAYFDIAVLSNQHRWHCLKICLHIWRCPWWTPEEFAQRGSLLLKSHWASLHPCYCCFLGAADCARLDETVLRHVPVRDECILVQVPICAVWHLCRQAASSWMSWTVWSQLNFIASGPDDHKTCLSMRHTFKYMSKLKAITRCGLWFLRGKKKSISDLIDISHLIYLFIHKHLISC